jgi:hypothetical protein
MVEAHYTVIIKPIPRGIGRDELVSNHLLPFGQIKNVRFGEGRGSAGDHMFVDYFDADSAIAAVKGLNGTRDPGTSHLVLSASLTKPTSDAIERLKKEEREREKAATSKLTLTGSKSESSSSSRRVRPQEGFKYLRSRDSGREICIIDFSKFQ